MDSKRSIVWRYYIDCRKTDNNMVECKSCKKKYAYKGNTTNMFQHIKTYHPHLHSEIVLEQHRMNASLQSSNYTFQEEEQRIKNHITPNLIEYADVDVKTETNNDSFCDQSFIAESPVGCEESLQEPSTSLAAIICPAGTSATSDCPAPKRKRSDIDISRMISSISSDIRSLIERSGTTSDAHFCHSIAFEIEKMDEDSKDLAKAAIWQVIYKVKSARKKNVELNLEDLFK